MTDIQQRTPHPLTLEDEKLRGVIFGDPGTGKTTLAASFPKPLIVDTDAGLVSVALYGREAEQFDPTGYKDLEDLYLYIKKNSDRYESIIIDSFTELQQVLLDEIVDDGAIRDAAKGKLNSITRFVPEQGEYLANQRQLRRILDAFRRLNKYVILTAQVRVRGMQRTPDCAPGALSIINKWSSFMGEIITHADSPDAPLRRYLVVEPTAERLAKSRYSGFGRYLQLPPVDPNDPEYDGRSGFDVLNEAVERSYIQSGLTPQAPHLRPVPTLSTEIEVVNTETQEESAPVSSGIAPFVIGDTSKEGGDNT